MAVPTDMADNPQMNFFPYFQHFSSMAMEVSMDLQRFCSGDTRRAGSGSEVLAQRVSSKEGPLEGAFVRSVWRAQCRDPMRSEC